jgi:hypothetical protein
LYAKFDDPIQVAFELNLIIEKNLNLNLNLVLRFALYLHCSLYSDTRGVTSLKELHKIATL